MGNLRVRNVGAVMLAGVFAALLAGSAGGCKMLKKEKHAFGEACTADTDCDSAHCSTFGNICTKNCTYDKDCGGDLVCRGAAEDDTLGLCAKPVGNPPNGGCMTNNDCQNGHCLKRVGEGAQPGICSKYCAAPDDCPAGMKICDKISDSGLLKFCLPGDEKSPPPKFAPAPKGPAARAPAPPPPATAAAATAAPAATPSTTASAKLVLKPPAATAAPSAKKK